jgi:hypothetical protein
LPSQPEYGGHVRYRIACGVLAATLAGLPVGTALATPPSTTPPEPPATSLPSDSAPDGSVPPASEEGGVVEGGAVDPQATPPLTAPLIPVPPGCEPPPEAHVVFLGTVIDRDFRTIRFRVDQVRFGRTAPFAAMRSGVEVIDIRFGLDVQYLDDGRQYLVGAAVDPVLGLLVSRVEPQLENFGGDEVIGVSETDVDCPDFDDPALTLHPDGTSLDGSMLQPLFDAKWKLAAAVATPFGLACGALFALSAFRLGITGALRGVFRVRPRRFS